MLRTAVLADDLTGAHISAVTLRAAGLHPRIVWEQELPRGCSAPVIDMRTRDRGGEARAVARAWAERLAAAGCHWMELRLDSTLRGRTSLELAGLLDVLGKETAIVAIPAFPSARRTTHRGRQAADGAPVARDGDVAAAVFGEDPAVNISVEILERGPEHALLYLDAMRCGAPIRAVVDGSGEKHLARAADLVAALALEHENVITVSPGAWLRYSRADPFVLVVIGTPTPQNVSSLALLTDQQGGVVRIPVTDLGTPPVCPHEIRSPTIVVDTIAAASCSDELLRHLAEVSVEVLRAASPRPCAGIVVSGGYTASHLVDCLECDGLVPVLEAAPLAAAGLASNGPFDGTPVITKGGLVGDGQTLLDLRDQLLVRTSSAASGTNRLPLPAGITAP